MCDEKIAEFLSSLKDRKIAYFGTAGFGGSEEYYQRLFTRIRERIDTTNEVTDYYFCQGRMPLSVRDRYVHLMTEHPDDENMEASIKNFDEALTHPDENDFEYARRWICGIIA